jgi:hypothetical protein
LVSCSSPSSVNFFLDDLYLHFLPLIVVRTPRCLADRTYTHNQVDPPEMVEQIQVSPRGARDGRRVAMDRAYDAVVDRKHVELEDRMRVPGDRPREQHHLRDRGLRDTIHPQQRAELVREVRFRAFQNKVKALSLDHPLNRDSLGFLAKQPHSLIS